MNRYIDGTWLLNFFVGIPDNYTLTVGNLRAIVNDAPMAEIADIPQGDVDAVAIFEREMHNLEQGYITIGEFDERIESLRHLCYGRPQGEWIDKGDHAECSNCGAHSGTQFDGVEPIPLKTNFCSNCGLRMKGAEDAVDAM